MKILMTSIVDLKKSQHNRPHQFVKYLSKNHEVTVLSINDWWKGGQNNPEGYSSDFDDVPSLADHWMTGKDGSDAAITTSTTAFGSRKPGVACPPLRCGGSGPLHTLAFASCPRPSVAGWRLGRSAAWAIFR